MDRVDTEQLIRKMVTDEVVNTPPAFIVQGDPPADRVSSLDIWLRGSDTRLPVPTSMYHPFEIIVEFADDTEGSTISVFVRHGAFIIDDPRTFVATDGTTEEAYSCLELYSGISAGDDVWATLDISSATPVAAIANEPLSEDDDHYSLLIGRVQAGGGIEQYFSSHITVSDADKQRDHSWMPTRFPLDGEGDPQQWASVTAGTVVFRDGAEAVISPGDIDFSTNTKFWLVIDYTSPAGTAGPNLTGGTSWPPFIDEEDDKINWPIMEFVGNSWNGLIRRQLGNIVDFWRDDPDADITDNIRKSVERCPTDDIGKNALQMRGFDSAETVASKVPHVIMSGEVKDIEWRYPVQGPGTVLPGGITAGQVVTDIVNRAPTDPSPNATASLGFKKRSHDVAVGDETWGEESTEPTDVSIGVVWTGGTQYQVWQKTGSASYGFDWTRAHE